ncbi:nitrous oxide reductase accessory protein NosL [Magnetococcus sp. PR-3]|uniref:nitrous oxide reductase accessory protein NosL n=1 Tax=Magnetococcus sp. PR-3 TaxID=3120355 RepID=UPI002FCE067C
MRILWLSLFVLLSACGGDQAALMAEKPKPAMYDDAVVGKSCGMFLSEHQGPVGQLFIKGEPEPFWFSTVRDMLTFVAAPEWSHRVVAAYVSDMASPSSWGDRKQLQWLDAKSSLYVIHSDQRGGMGGAESVPFASVGAAQAFVVDHGGKVVTLDNMPHSYLMGIEQVENETPSKPHPGT